MTDFGSGRSPRAEPDVGLRPRMVSIAYRMVGSVSEAEDIVQEAYLRVHRELRAGTQVESEQAYLTRVTTRLAIDHLRSARVRREEYFGPWLPEPLVDEVAPDVAEHADMADSLSMAFLVVLETLSPVERAVFLLHDVFDYGYDEIAEMVHKSEPNCRQIAARARRRVDAGQRSARTDRLAPQRVRVDHRNPLRAVTAPSTPHTSRRTGPAHKAPRATDMRRHQGPTLRPGGRLLSHVRLDKSRATTSRTRQSFHHKSRCCLGRKAAVRAAASCPKRPSGGHEPRRPARRGKRSSVLG